MAPPGHPGPALQTAPVAELEARANRRPNGKPRVPPVRLADCELLQLIQYHCDVEDPAAAAGGSSSATSSSSGVGSLAGSDTEGDSASSVAAARRRSKGPVEDGAGSSRDPASSSGSQRPTVVCTPFARFFRRCADGLMVETTKWEWWNAEEELDRRIKQETDSREGG